MRKALVLSLGVGATLIVAVFVGAAAATTGAPVFYDARYPAPASTGSEGYTVTEGGTAEPGSENVADEPDAEGAPLPTPDSTPPEATPHATPPAAAPPTGAPGTPGNATPTPDPDGRASDEPAPPLGGVPPSVEEQRTWLAFQQIVRECMADAGQEYLYWEWWNPRPDTSNRFAAMPADLTPEEYAAWTLALHGDSAGGDDYRWKDAGCWGYAVHVTGGTH